MPAPRPRHRLWVRLVWALTAVVATGCGESAPETGTVLRVATTQQGTQMRGPFRDAIREFEAAHPGVRVELNEMDDDVYQKMGLLTLFVGGRPPDVYFQWGGYLVDRYARAGYALDLTDEFDDERRREYLPVVWSSCRGRDGRVYLWPNSASVTILIWYRTDVFQRLGLQPPATWDEFLVTCERLRQAGVIPLAIGNKELWAGGNFVAAVAARRAGARRYNAILALDRDARMTDPDFVAAFEQVAELSRRGYLNRGPNGTSNDAARSLLAQGRAAMMPSGDWLVSEVEKEESALLDCFVLPSMPDQKGPATSLMALSTGYMIYRDTPHRDLTKRFLRHIGSRPVQERWTRAGHVSPLRALAPGEDAPSGQRRLWGFLERAEETVLAPDVGFNLEVADAFLDAAGLVLGDRRAPVVALDEAERQVAALRRERP